MFRSDMLSSSVMSMQSTAIKVLYSSTVPLSYQWSRKTRRYSRPLDNHGCLVSAGGRLSLLLSLY